MKLIDLNQTIFVPVVDETKGGMTVEMKMTVGDFFRKFCQGFEPKTVEAIPVEWLKAQMNDAIDDNETEFASDIDWLIRKYINEQEAR